MNEHLEIAIKAIELYAASHPRPPHVNQKQAAEMLGISEPTLRKLLRHGTIRLNKLGQIPVSEIAKRLW